MYIRLKTSKKAKYPTLQIVEGIRDGKKVRQRTIAHLGVIKGQEDLKRLKALAEKLIRRLEQEGLEYNPKIEINKLLHQKTIYDGFSMVTERLMNLCGFSQSIKQAQGKKSFDLEEIVKLIISQRLDLPSSKLRTFERQEEHGFYGNDLQHIYRTMDAIEPLNSEIQKQAFNAVSIYSDSPVDCFFFDVTTLYFESIVQDELKNFGFSKDQKYHTVQIVLALVVTSDGIPIAYEVFEGNLAETKTLIPVMQSLRNRFSIQNVIVVCDRGLSSKANIEALQDSNFNFVIATKLRTISKKTALNDLSSYKLMPNQENIPEEEKVFIRTMEHPQYKDTTLIITYSPNRAEKDRKDRERLIEKLKEKITSTNESSIKKVISNGGYKKFTNIKNGSSIDLNEKAIEEDAAWDGFHGIAVSNNSKLTTSEALSRYRDLWQVEEAFRVAKSTLKTRPIFHWKPHRIRAHVLLCFMTLFLERFLELLLRKNNQYLTPDKIRHALSSVHTMYFKEKDSSKIGKMQSNISEDAEAILDTLNISLLRNTEFVVPEK
jgi:transposase